MNKMLLCHLLVIIAFTITSGGKARAEEVRAEAIELSSGKDQYYTTIEYNDGAKYIQLSGYTPEQGNSEYWPKLKMAAKLGRPFEVAFSTAKVADTANADPLRQHEIQVRYNATDTKLLKQTSLNYSAAFSRLYSTSGDRFGSLQAAAELTTNVTPSFTFSNRIYVSRSQGFDPVTQTGEAEENTFYWNAKWQGKYLNTVLRGAYNLEPDKNTPLELELQKPASTSWQWSLVTTYDQKKSQVQSFGLNLANTPAKGLNSYINLTYNPQLETIDYLSGRFAYTTETNWNLNLLVSYDTIAGQLNTDAVTLSRSISKHELRFEALPLEQRYYLYYAIKKT